MNNKLFAPIATVAILISGAPAFAQQPPAPAAPASPLVHGAPIPGVCIYSRGRLLQTSEVGRYVTIRLRQIGALVNEELTRTQGEIQGAVNAFQAQSPTMTPEQRQQQGSALQQRAAQFDQFNDLRSAEMEATQQIATNRIDRESESVIQQVYQQRNCSILLNSDSSVMAAAPGMDLTAAVIELMNQKIREFPIERAQIDPATGNLVGQTAAPAGPARPAAPAAAPARPAGPTTTPPARGGRSGR